MLDAILGAPPPWIEAAYEARDIRSETAARLCRDCLSSAGQTKLAIKQKPLVCLDQSIFEINSLTGPRVDQIGGESRVQVAAVRVVRDAVLGLAIGNGARLAWLRGLHHAAKVGDVAAQVVGDALVVVVVAVAVRRVDAWPWDGPVAVRRHLVPFLVVGDETRR